MNSAEILDRLHGLSKPENLEGMARYGIQPGKALGISIPELRKIAREIGRNHPMADELWQSGIHEARILASMIADPKLLDEAQMESWAADFDSWDVCDQCCNNLFGKTKFAHQKVAEWSSRQEEFVKRAGFTLIAVLAVHDKKSGDEVFRNFLPIIKRESTDDRNFVKKAVNWALRGIGKRNLNLNRAALQAAHEISGIESPTARWIAADAIRELTNEKILERMRSKRGQI